MKKIHLNLGNYYGEVKAFKSDDGCHWMELDDFDVTSRTNITPELWDALAKEFGVTDLDDS